MNFTKTNKRWTEHEDNLINDLYKADYPIREIAERVNRTVDATRNRLFILRHNKSQDGFAKRQKWFEGARFGHLDIETTGFSANFDHMLSWAMYCPQDELQKMGKQKGGYQAVKPKDDLPGVVYFDVIRKAEAIDFDKKDKRLSQTLINCITDKADLLVTYYGTGFDIKFMRSRAMYWNQDFPSVGSKYHLDMYYRAKALGKLHRNSLAAHTAFLKIEGKDHVLGETA